VASLTVTSFSLSSSVSRILKAIVDSCWMGCADWWQGVGSIDLNLHECEKVCAMLDHKKPTLVPKNP